MRALGCLLILLGLGALAGEVALCWFLAKRFDEPLGVILGVVVTSAIGVKVVKAQASRLPMALLGGDLGRRMVGVIGGALLVFPGYASDVVGLILLLPFVQRVFAKPAGRLAQALMAVTMKRMSAGTGFPAGAGGFPGGAGGFPGGGFPMFPGMMPKGSAPLKPDEVARFGLPPLPPKGKAPRTYDTTADEP